MELSKHNIFGKIKNREDYFIVNLLSGQADILEPAFGKALEEGRCPDPEGFTEKGYYVDPEKEAERFRKGYLDFLDNRENSEIQIFYVPTYACNFSCSYCYQESYGGTGGYASGDVTEAFYRYVDANFAGRDKYITIFGGEPLLPGKDSEEGLAAVVEGAAARDLDIAVVTNGYYLEEYIDLLKTASVREVQVTLDGDADVHNSRRPLKSGGESFSKIVKGIDKGLAAGMTINLRVVVDRENIDNLPELAAFAASRGWTANPLFKTQLGRNYELHTCQSMNSRNNIFERAQMWAEIYDLCRKHPVLGEFHRPAFSVSRYLADNGELPSPLYDSCPGCKTEWAFDLDGGIYSCTATVGKPDERLGTFYPEAVFDEDTAELWEERDVTEIEKCRTCALQLACGGGCAAVAKNRNGSLRSPDCRPVTELLSMGVSHYFSEQVST